MHFSKKFTQSPKLFLKLEHVLKYCYAINFLSINTKGRIFNYSPFIYKLLSRTAKPHSEKYCCEEKNELQNMISKAFILLCLCALLGQLSAAPLPQQGESRKYICYVLKKTLVVNIQNVHLVIVYEGYSAESWENTFDMFTSPLKPEIEYLDDTAFILRKLKRVKNILINKPIRPARRSVRSVVQ